MKNSDIILVGGGVVSLLTAYFLEQSGATISIIDKSEIGKESSWAGGGILSPLYPWRYPDPINQLSRYSQQHYQALSKKLHSETGINPDWIESGMLMIHCKDDRLAIDNWAKQYNEKINELYQSEINQCEPQINPDFQQALFQKNISQIRNPWLVRSLKAYLVKQGINFIENTSVEKILTDNEKVTGVSTKNSNYKADKVIIASGAWSSLFSELKMIDVRPVMGQMILFKTEPGFLTRIVMHKGKYVIPRSDGHILCGSTIEWNGYEKITTQQTREDLHKAAMYMIPALENIEIVKQWSGLRPGSPNGVPYIGEHLDIEGLYVNTGHYRYGVAMGLASARLVTDIINNKASFVDKEQYSISAHREASDEFNNLGGCPRID